MAFAVELYASLNIVCLYFVGLVVVNNNWPRIYSFLRGKNNSFKSDKKLSNVFLGPDFGRTQDCIFTSLIGTRTIDRYTSSPFAMQFLIGLH